MVHRYNGILLLLFIRSVMSDSLWLLGLQHARLYSTSTPRACSNSCPLSRWCHPTILSSVIPFSSCLQSFPASGSFQKSQLSKTSYGLAMALRHHLFYELCVCACEHMCVCVCVCVPFHWDLMTPKTLLFISSWPRLSGYIARPQPVPGPLSHLSNYQLLFFLQYSCQIKYRTPT